VLFLLDSFTVAILAVLALCLHGAAIVSLLLYERRQPSATLAWVMSLVFLPFVGLFCYLLFGRMRARKVRKRYAAVVQRVQQVLQRYAVPQKLAASGEAVSDPRIEVLLRLGDRLTSTPASGGNAAQILVDAAAAYAAMSEAIRGAVDHVHVEFYIVQPDETGIRLRELLTERAKAGVEVRVVCDGLGSGRLPGSFWRPLEEAGGRAAWFRPVARILPHLPLRDRIDFRNHRKIVIADGRVGFTGGINVGREYLGLDPARGRWRDTHVRIEGPAVLSLQKAFAEDWLDATDELISAPRYFPDPGDEDRGPLAIQVVDSGPDRDWSPIHLLFVQAFALARDRIWVTSPYFVPTPSLQDAFVSAALRGVDVRLLVPRRSDSRLVDLVASSYFPVLLEAGVRVFLYERGFVHAKTMVVDDWVGTVGSANMDIRSFHLNYEVNAFAYGREFAERLGAQFCDDLEHATELKVEHFASIGPVRRLMRATARMMSPLL
jgi:cardiolipin synthase